MTIIKASISSGVFGNCPKSIRENWDFQKKINNRHEVEQTLIKQCKMDKKMFSHSNSEKTWKVGFSNRLWNEVNEGGKLQKGEKEYEYKREKHK